MTEQPEHVTQLLQKGKLPQAMELMYAELRQIAGRHMNREKPGHVLQPTALVNELYIKLAEQSGSRPRDRAHFLAIAAGLMRKLLVDYARTQSADKRWAGLQRVTVSAAFEESDGVGTDLQSLSDALDCLEKINLRAAKIVELRFFGGLTGEEIANYLDVSRVTVQSDWRTARAWLHEHMERQTPSGHRS